MGQNFSHVSNRSKKAEFQQVYDTALAFFVLNLVVVTLPTFGLFWVPYAGHWIQLGLAAMGLVFSSVLYSMAARYLGRENLSLNRSHWAFAVLTFLAALMGAALEAAALQRYSQCQADYNRLTSEYYAKSANFYQTCMASAATSAFSKEIQAVSSSSTGSSDLMSFSFMSCYYTEIYPAWTCWEFFDPAAIGFNAVAVPIFALVQMVLFSIVSSRLWNQVISLSYEEQSNSTKPLNSIIAVPSSLKSSSIEATPLISDADGLPMYRSDMEKGARM